MFKGFYLGICIILLCFFYYITLLVKYNHIFVFKLPVTYDT